MFFLGTDTLYNGLALSYLNDYIFVIIISIIFCMPTYSYIREKIKQKNERIFENSFYYFSNSMIYMITFLYVVFKLVNSTYNPFLYFRF